MWCAGIKVATQTPPVRSGRRVIFLTVDDGTGPADATFFEDVQGPYADTVFHAWMLLVRGVVRRTGPRGVSIRATGAFSRSVPPLFVASRVEGEAFEPLFDVDAPPEAHLVVDEQDGVLALLGPDLLGVEEQLVEAGGDVGLE